MECNLFSRIVPFLEVVIFILIHLTASLCAANDQYEICGRVTKCGNMTFTYPSYTWKQPKRPFYCGYSYYRFELHCRDNQIFTMDMEDVTYRVLAINDSAQTVTVARNDYWDTYCPRAYLNTTIDSKVFSGMSSNEDIIMYYVCPSNITGYANQKFSCVVNRTNTVGYYLTSFSPRHSMAVCHVSVNNPSSRSAIETLNAGWIQENLIAGLHGGFELIWDADNDLCRDCIESDGRCGHNDTSFKFSCHI